MEIIRNDSATLEGANVNEQVFNLLEQTNTNWSVSQHPLFTAKGLPSESVGIYKNDVLGEPCKWLGTKTDSYIPMQNADLAQTIVEASTHRLDARRR